MCQLHRSDIAQIEEAEFFLSLAEYEGKHVHISNLVMDPGDICRKYLTASSFEYMYLTYLNFIPSLLHPWQHK